MDARYACRILPGGDYELVSITDQAVHKFLLKSRPTNDAFWIGLHDTLKESLFQWVDWSYLTFGKSHGAYPWEPGQPDNFVSI